MSVITDASRCRRCARCVDICPGDLLYLPEDGPSAIREPRDCWDCMSCVKACPEGALETVIPFTIANFGASLRPVVSEDKIVWILRCPDGRKEEFTVPTTIAQE